MYYIYFPYAFILAAWTLFEFYKNKKPKWWALVILLAPITFPYYILKTKKEKGVVFVMIFLASFSAVIAGEVFLYSVERERSRYEDVPPLTRQMLRLTDELEAATEKLNSAIIKLEEMSKVESRIDKISETIDFIGRVKILIRKNRESISKVITVANNYKDYFQQEGRDWVFQIEAYYSNEAVVTHFKTLDTYLDTFERLLIYTLEHFYEINDAKDPRAQKNYDAYYMRYRRAVDRYYRFNLRRIEFQRAFLETYPALEEYLPGKRYTDSFRVWG